MNSLVGAVLLTQTGGILGPIASILGWIMDLLFRFTSIFGIEKIALCIILFTFVTKLLMMPLTVKQQISSRLMSVMQPELAAIQKKYKGKEGDQKAMMMMQTETKAVYEKYGTSMTGGCLPLLIQMPIILALYQIIYRIPAYVQSVRGYYEAVIAALPQGFETNQVFMDIAAAQKVQTIDPANINSVIDLLYKLTSQQWNELAAQFPQITEAVVEGGTNALNGIENMQTFLGLNIAYTPFQIITNFFNGVEGITILMAIAALAIPLLSGFFQWFSTRLMMSNQNNSTKSSSDEEAPGTSMMKSMSITMPLVSIFFCFSLATGIGIYWVAQSVFTIIQQVCINSYLKKMDLDDLVQKNVAKANKKRAKKGLPPTRIGNVDDMMQKRQAQEEKEEEKRMAKIAKTKAIVEENRDYYNKDAKPGSLAAKANMVAKYNEKHEKGGKK